uniref:AlNc14C257G9737 protein n=1 Tax=Albugo laibachii Nc14 TaxID=890382 RepID=F0WTR2_9STRA|nr:AlNc14C257G9737 [Albugo laibachii Nc14]|eukprot:CCA24755.1 AlNc14C257G9737 [Albugo laibachii Nc14]
MEIFCFDSSAHLYHIPQESYQYINFSTFLRIQSPTLTTPNLISCTSKYLLSASYSIESKAGSTQEDTSYRTFQRTCWIYT